MLVTPQSQTMWSRGRVGSAALPMLKKDNTVHFAKGKIQKTTQKGKQLQFKNLIIEEMRDK